MRPAAYLASIVLPLFGLIATTLGCEPRTETAIVGPAPSASASAHPPAPTPYSVPVSELPPADALPPGTTRILVLGDSVASFLGVAMRHRQGEVGAFVAVRGVGQCSVFAVGSRTYAGKPHPTTSCSTTWADDVRALRPDVTLVVLGGAFFGDEACKAEWLAAYSTRLLALRDAMGTDAGRIVLTRVPYPLSRWRHGDVLARVDCYDAMITRAAASGGLGMLDLFSRLCPTPACEEGAPGPLARPDGLHFDGVGAEETARWVLASLVQQARARDGLPDRPPPRVPSGP